MRWLVVCRATHFNAAHRAAIEDAGGTIDPEAEPIPLGDDEVCAEVDADAEFAKRLQDKGSALKAYPSSQMSPF